MRLRTATAGGAVLAVCGGLVCDPAAAWHECGTAAWYEFRTRTANGETADPGALTAAHPSLPFGTRVMVENLGNGRSVEVRINDRGPHGGRRIIDLSRAAAKRLGFIAAGTARVHVTAEKLAGRERGRCR